MARKKSGTISPPSMTEQAKWQATDDLRTLERATEIRMDTNRLRAAKAVAKKEMANLKQIAGSPEKKAAPKKRAATKKAAPKRKMATKPKTRARRRS